MAKHSREVGQQVQRAMRRDIMAQVESQAEALGATALTWVLFQGKRKTTEGFRQERCVGHLEPIPAPI